MAKKNQVPKNSPKPRTHKRSNIGDSDSSYENLRKGMEIPPKKKDK